MSASESAKLLERLVLERQAELNSALDSLEKTIALEDRAAKIAAAEACTAALDNLCSVLSRGDWPRWTRALRDALSDYIGNAPRDGNTGRRLLESLRTLRPKIWSQDWQFLGHASAAVDFESVYDEFYSESRMPELFDELVGELQQVIDSGLVDSLRILEALDTLIATVRKNSRRDVLAAYGAIGFARTFMQKFLWAALDEIPGVKPVAKAIRETLDELDTEFLTTQTKASERVAELVEAGMPVDFTYRPKSLPPAGEED